MGTCRVIVDADAVVGFCLAGVEAVAAGSPEEAERLLRESLTAGDATLVLVGQRFLDGFGDAFRRRLERLNVPIVVPIPISAAAGSREPARDYVLSLIRRAIGFQMKLTKD